MQASLPLTVHQHFFPLRPRCRIRGCVVGICRIELASVSNAASCNIREAGIADLWQVADTHCSVFLPDQGLLQDLILRMDRMMALLGSFPLPPQLKKKILMAFEDEEIAGVLSVDNIGEFLPRRGPFGQRRSGIAYISNVAVVEGRRRRGIAKKLLNASEKVAKEWSCRSVALHCDAENDGAVALYLSQGYNIVNTPLSWPHPPGTNFLFAMKSIR